MLQARSSGRHVRPSIMMPAAADRARRHQNAPGSRSNVASNRQHRDRAARERNRDPGPGFPGFSHSDPPRFRPPSPRPAAPAGRSPTRCWLALFDRTASPELEPWTGCSGLGPCAADILCDANEPCRSTDGPLSGSESLTARTLIKRSIRQGFLGRTRVRAQSLPSGRPDRFIVAV